MNQSPTSSARAANVKSGHMIVSVVEFVIGRAIGGEHVTRSERVAPGDARHLRPALAGELTPLQQIRADLLGEDLEVLAVVVQGAGAPTASQCPIKKCSPHGVVSQRGCRWTIARAEATVPQTAWTSSVCAAHDSV